MALSLDDVKRLALLARIAVTEEQARQVLAQLSGVFELIEQMQAVNTDGVEPMSHAQDIALRLRADEVIARDRHELFQSLAPRVEAGLYLVPKVIE